MAKTSWWARLRRALRIAAYLGMLEPKIRFYEEALDNLERRSGAALGDPNVSKAVLVQLVAEWAHLSAQLSREVRELKEWL